MKYFTLLIALITCPLLQSQTPCGYDLLQQQTLQNPEFIKKQQALEEQIYQFLKNKPSGAEQAGAVVTIPTVVHIIHNNGPENISDAQVQQAIQWLNQALSNSGPFNQGSGADTEIQLCLAQRTPGGVATKGITRDQSPLTVIADVLTNDAALKNLNRWAPKEYLNIWVVRSICTNASGCSITAYAYAPIYHGSNSDGIVIEADFFGTSLGNTAALAHELGHYFGLYHTFEGGCQNYDCLLAGDRVCDTPPDQSTAAVPCGQTVNTCSTDTQSGFSTDQPDMTWNFMDYGKYACMHDFTAGQVARMQTVLNGTRKSLLTSRGCLPPCPAPATAAFAASATTVNAGATVTFINQSQNFGSLQWTVNGTPFSTAANPMYTFNTVGLFTIGLAVQAIDTLACSGASTTQVIRVLCPVEANFTVSNLTPEEGETIVLTNTSQNATQYEWFVNGLSQGSVLDSLVLPVAGNFEIKLVASNGACSDVKQVLVSVIKEVPCLGYNFIKTYHGITTTSPDKVRTCTSNDGSIYLATSTSGSGVIVKTDALGSLLWTRRLTIPSSEITAITATPDNGLAIIYNQVGFSPQTAGVFKLASNGTVLWSRELRLVVPITPDRMLHSISTTSDGGFIIGGLMRASTGGAPRAYVSKIDSDGNQLWANVYGIGISRVTDIFQTNDGGYLCLLRGDWIGGGGQLLRLDAGGNVQWAKNNTIWNVTKIVPTPDGNFLLATPRHFYYGMTCNAELVKIKPDGTVLWGKTYAISTPLTNLCFSGIAAGNYGGYRITGIMEQDFPSLQVVGTFVLKVDESGNIQDGQVFYPNQTDIEFTDIQRKSGGYILCGLQPIGHGILQAVMDEAGNMGDCPTGEKPVFTSKVLDTDTNGEPLQVLPGTSWVVLGSFPLSSQALTDTLRCEYRCDTLLLQPEICNNNIDDDGDGLFDCLDPDCDCPENTCQPKQADIWYFGKNSGLDFSTDPPTVLTDGQTDAAFSSAVANDAQGNLLFYSDGTTVYNRLHQPMPNGAGLPPTSITERRESLILAHPAKASLYYLINLVTDVQTSASRAVYSVIDLQLDNGRGDVVPGQQWISLLAPGDTAVAKLAAVRSCTFNGYWLIIKKRAPAPAYLAYRLDASGLNSTPIISPATAATSLFGQMKFSPDGLLLAEINQGDNVVAIYNFDSSSGKVSLDPKFKASLQYAPFGLEFSPDGRLLYVSVWDEAPMTFHSEIIQFNLQAPLGADLSFSTTPIATLPALPDFRLFGALQLGPDGKIYISTSTVVTGFKPKLHVIHHPNRPGTACQFQADAISLAPSAGANSGLCNFPASLFALPNIAFPENAPDTICSLNEPTFYQIALPCATDSIVWKLEGLSGTVQSNFQFASVTYTSAGKGRLIVQVFTPCGMATDTLPIVAEELETPVLDLGPDRLVCDNGVFTFQAGPGFERYRWQDGSADSVFTTLFPGKYWVDVWDFCGKLQTDTITVSIAPATVLNLGPDLEHCPGKTTTFDRPAIFSHWQWLPADAALSCDTCENITLTPWTSGSYQILAQTADGCISVDTLNVQINDTTFRSLDTIACANAGIEIFGVLLPADTTAQFLFNSAGPGQCDTLWTVHVFSETTSSGSLDTVICPENQLEYQGIFLNPGTETEFRFAGSNGCDSVVTVRVAAFPELTVQLPADTTLGIGARLSLNTEITGTGPFNYTWAPANLLDCSDCPAPTVAPLVSTLFTLQVSDANGCQQADSILVTVDSSCRWLPVTAFTPDGDGNNDWFYPNTSPCVTMVRHFQIFNRWGQVVFERSSFLPNQENLGWDGKDGPSDVYIWLVELEYYDGRIGQLKGEVTLLR